MEAAIVILSILALFQFSSNVALISLINKLKKEKSGLEKEKEYMAQILPGDKVTFQQNLVWQDKISFSVFFEAGVTEVSESKVKVDAYNFTTDENLPDEILKSKSYKQDIINFMQGKWIDRKKISQMIGQQFIRDKKINEVLK